MFIFLDKESYFDHAHIKPRSEYWRLRKGIVFHAAYPFVTKDYLPYFFFLNLY